MTEIEYATIEHLDFDYAPPCECRVGGVSVNGEVTISSDRCPYDAEAKYRVTPVYCCAFGGQPRLWCQKCLDKKLAADAIACPDCLTRWVPGRSAYKTIEPL